jgi:hypothetical protein
VARAGASTLSVVAALASLAACAAGGTGDGGQTATELALEPVVKEIASGLTEPVREVVRDDGRWARLWERIQAGATPPPPRPAVDFSRQMLIVVATGNRPTGGFDVAIRRATVRDAALEVEVLESCPAQGALVSMGLTQPVEVVLLDRVPQAPRFRDTKGPSCR